MQLVVGIMYIKFGDMCLDNNVFLAPMAGVTDYPFRKIVRKFGNYLVFSEMIASQAMIRHIARTKKMVDKIDDNTVVQIAGSDPNAMAEAAKISVDCGARFIDINMGCPVKKIVNNYAGSALMKDEVLAGKIMESVVNAVSVPVSLKTRLGWDKEHINIVSFANIAQSAGIKMMTVHGRTRSQMFNGKVDWAKVLLAKRATNIPVIVNGDISCADDAEAAMHDSEADGVMVGRAAVGAPWILNIIDNRMNGASLIAFDKKELLKEHVELMLEFYDNGVVFNLCRKVLLSYCKGFANAASMRDDINRIADIDDLKMIMTRLIELL